MKTLILGVLITRCLIYAEVNEVESLDLKIALITKEDLRVKGYEIGQDAARSIRRIESSTLMQNQTPVDGISFCNQVYVEEYAMNEQFNFKLAQEDNDAIFRGAILKGCNDYMNGRITVYEEVIVSSEYIDSTDVNSIQKILNQEPILGNTRISQDSIDNVIKQVEEGFYKNKERYVK